MIVYVICFYLLHLNAWPGRAEHVEGSVGDTITLPCHYTVHKYQHYVCWGRGSCPYSECNGIIIQTDGSKVTRRQSDRYQLLGNISQGNVSLTITDVTENDGGTYCCRVEIPGWFSDLKGNIDVKIITRYENPATVTAQVNQEQSTRDILEFFSFTTQKTFVATTETDVYSPNSAPFIFFRVATLVLYMLLTLGILYTWKCHKSEKT